jgi:hypothetical protein
MNLRFLYKAPYNHENAANQWERAPDPNAVTFVTARYAIKAEVDDMRRVSANPQAPLPASAAILDSSTDDALLRRLRPLVLMISSRVR